MSRPFRPKDRNGSKFFVVSAAELKQSFVMFSISNFPLKRKVIVCDRNSTISFDF